jgi:hypothetical protein
MSEDLIEVEIVSGRNRLTLRKVKPGEMLQAACGAVSFFYEILLNGQVRGFTNDPEAARAIWRGCMRWMRTGHTSTAEVLP